MATSSLVDLTASEARDKMAKGEFTAEAYTKACLAEIAVRDTAVEAWTHLDP